MKIIPIQNNILIEPIREETAFSTAMTQYEERGKVIAIADSLRKLFNGFDKAPTPPKVDVGDIIYFDSWQAAKFKNGDGQDIWLVHIDAVRAVEKHE